MGRYALIVTETGRVDNVIVYDGVSPFNPGPGMELREAGNNAEPGGTWDGSKFVRAPVVEPTRTQILMYEVTNPVASYDENDDPVNKADDVVAAEKLELKNLLLAELQAGDLSADRTQTLLRLERE
tara:strand:- start:596 stop:973 length:378 start_codon:yes stop_codon:yes gene_type:complete